MEHLMDVNAKFTFTCSHSIRAAIPDHINAGMRKEGVNIGFWIQEFEKIDGKLPLVGVLEAAEAPKAKSVPAKETEPEKLEEEAATNNAFDDDGDE